ncbi:alternate-type signal peptide domain-containing protein [Herbiconiux sp. A18JL235]|uniref:Alternate-type signal peptide domain-containing protein n=1 Tax=Herbiconiux sp. A18JL235 TaxID=3152363 RepID=A0AB39BKW2_9MICO
MNKLAKGAIAGAAGLVLLLGGAGTFAFWNSTAAVTGGTISAGNLVVTDDGAAGVWTDQNGATVNLSTYKIVPGDTLTYTDTLLVTAVGQNLEATLGLTSNAIHTPASPTAADTALVGYLTANTTVDLAANDPAISGTSPNYTITAGASGITDVPVVVTVTVPFPYGTAGSNNDAKLGTAVLDDMAVNLSQIQ